MNDYFKYTSLGIQIVAIIGVFILIGRFLDNYFLFEKPWFTLVLALLGSVGVIFMLVKKVK